MQTIVITGAPPVDRDRLDSELAQALDEGYIGVSVSTDDVLVYLDDCAGERRIRTVRRVVLAHEADPHPTRHHPDVRVCVTVRVNGETQRKVVPR